MAQLPVAAAADLLRAAQKDREYREELRSHISDVLAPLLSPSWQPSRDTLTIAGDALYYTLAGSLSASRQTTGEEYCDLIPVDRNFSRRSSVSARLLMALLHAAGRAVSILVLRRLGRIFLRALVSRDAVESGLDFFTNAHTALFYLSGMYLEFPKRALGIRYVQPARSLRGGLPTPRYGILGILLGLQVVLTAYIHSSTLAKFARRHGLRAAFMDAVSAQDLSRGDETSNDQSGSSTDSDRPPISHSDKKCTLCLSEMAQPTATECGHVFCWACIASWCATKEGCPLCRQPVDVKNLVCLYYY